jgi:hypothetical protein
MNFLTCSSLTKPATMKRASSEVQVLNHPSSRLSRSVSIARGYGHQKRTCPRRRPLKGQMQMEKDEEEERQLP